MDGVPEASPMVPGVSPEQFVALQNEVTELRARLDDLVRALQLRDSALQLRDSALQVRDSAMQVRDAAPVADDTAVTALPRSYEIAADQLLPVQDGFYQLEWGPEGAFRWTGPEAATHFEAWIDRSGPLTATLRLFHFGTPANAKELSIEVDGVRYAMTRTDDEKVLHSEPIAAREGHGATRFTLHVPHVHSPSAARGAADKRTLGVAFQTLRVDPA